VVALDDVSLDAPKGQFVVLIGPSGGGKSTLLNAIAGLVKPSSGSIVAAGQPVVGPSRERGMVFQQDSVFPWMKVRDNIAYGLRARKASREVRERTVAEYLRATGLERFAGSWPKELSGGMRKRVAVAAAFASDPEILLMDEPFASLDFVTRTRMHLTLIDLWSATNKTVIFVTHDVDEAITLADRIVVLVNGKIVDDLLVKLPRPRKDSDRIEPHVVELRRKLLERLGLTETL
jgi:NitT/TauT family transport system ATP-binding protein